MPKVADGIPVRYVDVASPWLREVGAHPRGTRYVAAAVGRVLLTYDDAKSGIVHTEEYEMVLSPLTELADVDKAIDVDYDDRDMLDAPLDPLPYQLCDAPIANKTFWTKLQRDLVDSLQRSRKLSVPANKELKLAARPGETDAEFAERCRTAADERADADAAKLKDKYATKINRLSDQMKTAEGRVNVLEQQKSASRNNELLSAADSILGGLFGGSRSRRSTMSSITRAANNRGRTSTVSQRVTEASGKVQTIADQLAEAQQQCQDELQAIDDKWGKIADTITTLDIPLGRGDVDVKQLVLAWLPVAD
jgi:hypothetical protein